MASDHAIRTPRLRDSQIVKLIFSLKQQIGLVGGHIHLGGNAIIHNLHTTDIDNENIRLINEERYAIFEVHLNTSTGVGITFRRGISQDYNNAHRSRQSSPYFDEIILSPSDDNIASITSCIDIIEEEIPPLVSHHLSEGGQNVMDFLQLEINLLSEQYRNMLSGLSEERSEFRKFMDESRENTKNEYDEQKRRWIADDYDRRARFQKYKEAEEEELQTKRNELERKEQEIDNRQHMHARRELREQITENFKGRIREPIVSKGPSIMRLMVFFLTLVTGIVIGFYGISSFGELVAIEDMNGVPDWLLIVWVLRSVVMIVLAAGFVAYSINWLRSIYLDDVRARQRYERYGNDMDRASFVIETIMEVGEKNEVEVPDAWIEGVCRNLFADKDRRDGGDAVANPLAMLLQSISGAKLGPNGAEVTMSRRDARRLSKDIREG